MATGEDSPNLPTVPPVDLGPIGPKARYEFTKPQEAVIGDLAGKMRFVGAFMFALAMLGALQGALFVANHGGREFDALGLINVLIFGLIGFWTLSAAREFSAVVETKGWDVPHLMDALRSLRKMYTLLFALLIGAIIASIVLMIAFRFRA